MPVSSLPPYKRRKISVVDDKLSRIKRLESDLNDAISKNSSLNALVELLDIAQTAKDPQLCSKSIYALYRIFVSIIGSRRLALKGDENARVVRGWIWERLNTYTDLLVSLMSDQEKSLRISSLQILFSLLKHLSTSLSQSSVSDSGSFPQPQFHVSYFNNIISGLLVCSGSARSVETGSSKLDHDVRDSFLSTWLNVHDDIRWFFLRDAASFLIKHPTGEYPDVAENLLSILGNLQTFPTEPSDLGKWWVSELGSKPPPLKSSKPPQEAGDDETEEDEAVGNEDDWRKFFDEPVPPSTKLKANGPSARLYKMTIHQSLHSLASHRAVFSRAWLTLLPRLNEIKDVEKRKALAVIALNMMHRNVIPHLTRPVMIMDWVGSCIDYGETVGLLALNALFLLMRDYNLDYPSFYTRLYAFLDRGLLHHKHRARFFRLTELFLSSTHLPATLLASFIKRLSRLSLTAPPAAIIMIIPFTYNILKRHPALMAMINRVDDSEKDPFNPYEKDPMSTNALESSLWELITHLNHYHSPVSTLAKIFQEAFRKQNYDMEEFLDHTYGTLFDSEVKRKIKKEPAIAMELKQYTFPTADEKQNLAEEELTMKGDVVAELWTF